jgi:hypothetical protein
MSVNDTFCLFLHSLVNMLLWNVMPAGFCNLEPVTPVEVKEFFLHAQSSTLSVATIWTSELMVDFSRVLQVTSRKLERLT